jgi:hypothetical protein
MIRRILPVFFLCLVSLAAPPVPPGPADYDIDIRYRIDAIGNDRIVQHAEMLQSFKEAGFSRSDTPAADEPINRSANRLTGSVSARGLPRIVGQRHVRSVVALPTGASLPEGDTRVRVDIYLVSGFLRQTQQTLARQTVKALTTIGFIEAFSYDHESDSRLVGSIPASKAKQLIADARTLFPAEEELPAPLSKLDPIRVAIVRPDLPAPKGRPLPPRVPEGQEKFSSDLRAALASGGPLPGRLEVILDFDPDEFDPAWLDVVRREGVIVEGRVGPLVSVSGDLKTIAPELAKQPRVVAVRLPRRATSAPALKADVPADWSPLRRSGLVKLHAMARKGKGVHIAVLAEDFTGWEALPGVKEGRVKHMDLTASRSPELLPAPPADGRGKHYAQSVITAAPEANVYLVRVDPYAPYMMYNIARAINRETPRSHLMDQRFAELQADRESLEELRNEVELLRRLYLNDPRENEEGLKRRAAFDKAEAEFVKLNASIRARSRRWVALSESFRDIKGVHLVASTLVWNDGFPVDGTSALSRYFDDRPFKAALWFQAAGDTRGQAWSGLFRDSDGNRRMEFFAPKDRLPKDSWTPEIAWIDWQSPEGKAGPVPAKAKLRVVLQWKEAHEALPLLAGDDPYRNPLADLRLVVVRQPDPSGKMRPADDLEVVAQSTGVPQRLEQTLTSGTYEILVEVPVSGPGRYGVLIEGQAPESTFAPGEASLPATRRKMELRPRLFLDAPGGPGRPVFADVPTDAAAFGVPADARRVWTVGAVDAEGKPRPDSALGTIHGAALRPLPALLADGPLGTADATCFAVGLAACSVSVKGSFAAFLERVREQPARQIEAPVPAAR